MRRAAFARRVRAEGGRVVITSNGLVGDSGVVTPSSLLGLGGETREPLVATADTYRSALVSREIGRAVRVATITEGAHLMTRPPGAEDAISSHAC